jgi:hypothetical protein
MFETRSYLGNLAFQYRHQMRVVVHRLKLLLHRLVPVTIDVYAQHG